MSQYYKLFDKYIYSDKYEIKIINQRVHLLLICK